MVFLPLLLIWLRDPMYFNAPARWGVVLLAVSIALLDAHRAPAAPVADRPEPGISAALPEHRWLHTSHAGTIAGPLPTSTTGGQAPPQFPASR